VTPGPSIQGRGYRQVEDQKARWQIRVMKGGKGDRPGCGSRGTFNIPQVSFQGSILRIEQSVVLNRGHFDVKQMINVHPQTNTRNQLPHFREQQPALTGNDISRTERDQCTVTRLRLGKYFVRGSLLLQKPVTVSTHSSTRQVC
jgi:hypothetical protein